MKITETLFFLGGLLVLHLIVYFIVRWLNKNGEEARRVRELAFEDKKAAQRSNHWRMEQAYKRHIYAYPDSRTTFEDFCIVHRLENDEQNNSLNEENE